MLRLSPWFNQLLIQLGIGPLGFSRGRHPCSLLVTRHLPLFTVSWAGALHTEAVSCMLQVSRQMKMEIPVDWLARGSFNQELTDDESKAQSRKNPAVEG